MNPNWECCKLDAKENLKKHNPNLQTYINEYRGKG